MIVSKIEYSNIVSIKSRNCELPTIIRNEEKTKCFCHSKIINREKGRMVKEMSWRGSES